MKIGFALEGGAMKGLYTAGALDYLLSQDFKIDYMVGVSAGSLFGVNYKSRQLGRAIRYNLKYCKEKDYKGFYSLITTGNIMNKDFCFNKLVYTLDPFDFETFRNNPLELECVVTNIVTNEAKYVNLYDLDNQTQLEYLRATGSMPYVSKPVEIDNEYYLDGAITDSIPYKRVMEKCEKTIVISTKPKGYRKSKHNKLMANMFYSKYPKFKEGLLNRYKMYNKQMEEVENLSSENKIFFMQPSVDINIKRLENNPKKLQAIYDLGYNDMKQNYEKLLKFIKD